MHGSAPSAAIALSVAWIDAPRALVAPATCSSAGAPSSASHRCSTASPTPLLLLAAGPLLYIAGAAVYAVRRPNPWPAVFGFHEVFHGLVVAAAVTHFVTAAWIVPA